MQASSGLSDCRVSGYPPCAGYIPGHTGGGGRWSLNWKKEKLSNVNFSSNFSIFYILRKNCQSPLKTPLTTQDDKLGKYVQIFFWLSVILFFWPGGIQQWIYTLNRINLPFFNYKLKFSCKNLFSCQGVILLHCKNRTLFEITLQIISSQSICVIFK